MGKGKFNVSLERVSTE